MSIFMAANKSVIVKSVTQNLVAELDIATTFSFHIYERNQNSPLTAIDYRITKVSGRTVTVLQAWTGVSLIGVDDDVYTFDVTVTAVTAADNLTFEFKVIDTDGVESFREISDVNVIV